jgi:hypothetical protein
MEKTNINTGWKNHFNREIMTYFYTGDPKSQPKTFEKWLRRGSNIFSALFVLFLESSPVGRWEFWTCYRFVKAGL